MKSGKARATLLGMKRKRKHSLVVVANRLPVSRSGPKGKWKISPGGLVTALKPIVVETSAVWVGWSGVAGTAPPPFESEGFRLHPVPVSAKEVDTFYNGFSNRTLWPLYHDAVRYPEFHREWWAGYMEVNRRYAEAAAELAAPGALVWVHDYHLQLVPVFLRNLRSDLRIGFFLHVPFPPQELFAQLPWRKQIMEGLAAADLVGFQTARGARNFSILAKRYIKAKGNSRLLHYGGREIKVGAFPVSVDFKNLEAMARDAKVQVHSQELHRKLGQRRKVFLGVDRMDYTKGIDIRLKAYKELLMRKEISVENCVLVQVAVPSREPVASYANMRNEIERLVGEINGEFGEVGLSAVHYFYRSFPPDELVALYCMADVMLVTPFRDGMNLVAKEYVCTRVDRTGVLVLSEFTGSAVELKAALQVNPHDVDGLEEAYLQALRMPASEATRRMKRLRAVVKSSDVMDWGSGFLKALEDG